MKYFNLLFFTLSLLIASLSLQAQNIVKNASFELNTILDNTALAPAGRVAGTNYTLNSANNIELWSPAEAVAYNNFGDPIPASSIASTDVVEAFDGFIYSQTRDPNVALKQDLDVVPGTTYYVCAWTRAYLVADPEYVDIQIDRDRITSGIGLLGVWTPTPLGSFVATSNTVELSISDNQTETYIDLVYVGTEATCPTSFNDANLDGIDDGLADTDGDGVQDFADECPGTPNGTAVDAKGCPDTDGDAFTGAADPDGADPCNPDPNSPACSSCSPNLPAPKFGND